MQPNVDPIDLMADFEVVIRKSFNSSFHNSPIVACLFYLGQYIFRKIVDLGLKEKYNKHSEFCLKVRCFSALAFLPIEDVEEAYEELIDDDEIPSEVIAYFDVTYMGTVRGSGARKRRDLSIFLLDLWNVNERILQELPITNNAAEGFHSAIKRSAGLVLYWGSYGLARVSSLLKLDQMSLDQKSIGRKEVGHKDVAKCRRTK
ncbi:uncharacterized protein [Palaemon carinicauda]|uniref:uncharacterized protein n=1 Tax=Palaemon carinicauda TaxID=392227 RepID=UPI0035B5A968